MHFTFFLWIVIGSYWSLEILRGPYRSLLFRMDSNGPFWVLISPHASLWVLMRSYSFFASLWISIGAFGSSKVLVCPYGL